MHCCQAWLSPRRWARSSRIPAARAAAVSCVPQPCPHLCLLLRAAQECTMSQNVYFEATAPDVRIITEPDVNLHPSARDCCASCHDIPACSAFQWCASCCSRPR